ncbi:hypothetical protein [Methylorubrum populi]|uniref:Uncharacterized protein n=1 Tax=Methylorubrum populi TaxID=223967 RepID=A0A833J059_9HYPH|nr:hypothetical protein [Methylorubrum populi]KAB7782133.1 hypothetical protein F8B43_4888 [Methylorubrum populi]
MSTMMFNDGKRIGLLRKGGDIGSRSLVVAFQWLSDRWPEGAVWPDDVPRPAQTEPSAAEPASDASLVPNERAKPLRCLSAHGSAAFATEGQSR